jgi:hypothetical protein
MGRYVFLQVTAHYTTHDDIVTGVVNLIKKLKIKRIVIGSRSELNLHITTHSESQSISGQILICLQFEHISN